MWLDLFVFYFFSYVIIQLVRLILADADLTLLWKEKFGKKPAVLKGSVVWITGASSGIGEYLAYELAKAGCKLVLSARREKELNRVKQQCLIHGCIKDDDILVLPLDLLEFDKHNDHVNKVLATFQQIDILVNNGGRSQRGYTYRTDLDIDRAIMELNFLGTLSLTKAVLPHMLKRQYGHVVVTSSLAGKIGTPFSGAYSATKFALQGWFDTLRVEVADHRMNVTLICPGPVVSDIRANLFTEAKGKPPAIDKGKIKLMSTERCAELIAIGMANKLDEIWISNQPWLGIAYMVQYMPDFTRQIVKILGTERIMHFKKSNI